jgi:uncharacterized protein (DUF433 family)
MSLPDNHVPDVGASDITFNQGIFTAAEVALFAKLHPTTVKRWFFSNHMGKAVMPPSGMDNKTLSFWDLVQAMAVRSIRREKNVPLPKIREAVQRAETNYGLTHIFARPHQTVLFMGDIFIYPAGQEAPVQLTGKRPHQLAIRHLVEPYQRDLAFDASGLATLFTAFRFADQAVIIDPAIRFGEPFVQSCGYSARTLYEAVLSEGGVAQAANAFAVEEAAVDAAFRYYDSLPLAA